MSACRAVVALAWLLAGCLPVHGHREVWLAPSPDVASALHPAARLAPADPEIEILYVTDRAPLDQEPPALAYGWLRGQVVRIGEARVILGPDETAASLHARTTTPGHRDRVRVLTASVEERGTIDEGALEELVRERLHATSSGDVYVTVHGIASGFGESLYALAQIWHHLGRRGAPIAYSWPTGKGKWIANAYGYERESGEFTLPHLVATLRRLAAMPEVERIHVIAHSLGNTVLLDALRQLQLQLAAEGRDARSTAKLDTLVLAAPDISADVFRARFIDTGVPSIARRTVLYVSDNDKALSASSWMHGSRRIGTSTARQLNRFVVGDAQGGGVEIVDCAGYQRGGSHDYYLTDPSVLGDVLRVLVEGAKPSLGAEPPVD